MIWLDVILQVKYKNGKSRIKLGKILMMYSREYAKITYVNGGNRCVNITGDSCIAIMHDVYRAIC